MKYILSILVLALVCAAAPASAANYYEYDYTYYMDSYISTPDPASEAVTVPEWGNSTHTVSYQIENNKDFSVFKTSYYDNGFSNQDSYYRFKVTGENVKLFLVDYMDNSDSSQQKDHLLDKTITNYGYRFTGSDETITWKMSEVTSNPDQYISFTPYTSPNSGETMVRHGYYLGEFKAGDEFEVYMQADGYGQAWSDTTGYKGGYGIGVPASDSVVQAQQHISWEQARKVMPLAALDVGSGHRVFFGLYVGADDDKPFGSPLPGGLPTALTCGIFALGFWYVRRRKAVAA